MQKSVLLDSSAIINYIRNQPEVVNLVSESLEVSVSSISMFEILQGEEYLEFVGRKSHKDIIQKLVDYSDFLVFDKDDAEMSSKIMAYLKTKGQLMSSLDIMILSQAIVRDKYFVTYDKDFLTIKEHIITICNYDKILLL